MATKQELTELLKNTLDTVNELLALEGTQRFKSQLCSLAENILMKTDCYNGFQYNYWSQYGCGYAERMGGLNEVDPENRNAYIIGPEAVYDTDSHSNVIHPGVEGEYSRCYNTHKLQNMLKKMKESK